MNLTAARRFAEHWRERARESAPRAVAALARDPAPDVQALVNLAERVPLFSVVQIAESAKQHAGAVAQVFGYVVHHGAPSVVVKVLADPAEPDEVRVCDHAYPEALLASFEFPEPARGVA